MRRAPYARTVGRSFGQLALAVLLLAAGLFGVAVVASSWPRDANTSPLVALFASAWSCAYLTAGVLAWRGSRFAAVAFIAAIGLLLPVFSFIFPGNTSVAASAGVAIVLCVGLLGYRYLRQPFVHARYEP